MGSSVGAVLPHSQELCFKKCSSLSHALDREGASFPSESRQSLLLLQLGAMSNMGLGSQILKHLGGLPRYSPCAVQFEREKTPRSARHDHRPRKPPMRPMEINRGQRDPRGFASGPPMPPPAAPWFTGAPTRPAKTWSPRFSKDLGASHPRKTHLTAPLLT